MAGIERNIQTVLNPLESDLIEFAVQPGLNLAEWHTAAPVLDEGIQGLTKQQLSEARVATNSLLELKRAYRIVHTQGEDGSSAIAFRFGSLDQRGFHTIVGFDGVLKGILQSTLDRLPSDLAA